MITLDDALRVIEMDRCYKGSDMPVPRDHFPASYYRQQREKDKLKEHTTSEEHDRSEKPADNIDDKMYKK